MAILHTQWRPFRGEFGGGCFLADSLRSDIRKNSFNTAGYFVIQWYLYQSGPVSRSTLTGSCVLWKLSSAVVIFHVKRVCSAAASGSTFQQFENSWFWLLFVLIERRKPPLVRLCSLRRHVAIVAEMRACVSNSIHHPPNIINITRACQIEILSPSSTI